MAKNIKEKKVTKGNSVKKTIRFQMDEFEYLEGLAKSRKEDFSKFVRNLLVGQLTNIAQHEELIASLNSKDPEAVQKTFFETMNSMNEVLLTAVSNNNELVKKRLKIMDGLLREMIYLLMYFNREVPDEDKEKRRISALRRQKDYLEAFDKENG
jgi:hypothetical protein